jgi:two-component system response regulator HydG
MKKQGTILIVDDNRNILTTVRILLEPIFDGIITIANPNSIPAKLREEHPDVVLLDMNFSSGINSGNEGLYWLREIKSLSPKTEVVLFTACGYGSHHGNPFRERTFRSCEGCFY